jgi:metallo-beta-lactamase family protein
MNIQHNGAVNGVTGSCHQLHIDEQKSILIDCGLFQGIEEGKEQDREKGTYYLSTLISAQ